MIPDENATPETPAADDGASQLERLLLECLEQAERGGPAAVNEFCRLHPEHADALRRDLATLDRLGLLAPAAPAGEVLPAERIGEYRLIRRLGEGGMGVVYLAEQTSLRRLVALKLLRAAPGAGTALATRFHREALTAAKLRHPNIVTLYAAGEEGGLRYLAMELVPGRGLDEILAQALQTGTWPAIQEIVRWGRDLARALECAHAAGVVHRDLKPSNVRIRPDGRALLLDFGLARDLQEPSLTRTGEFQGSPHYASPEQVGGGRGSIGPLTDVYSLGATLYECAAGRVPFGGETTAQLFQKILTREPDPPRSLNPAVPRDLQTVIQKAMEKDPTRRYAGAGAFADDLDAILELRPVAARSPGPLPRLAKWARRNPAAAAGAATSAAALIVLLLVLLLQSRAARERTRDEARAALLEARGRLAALLTSRVESGQSEHRLARLREDLQYRHLATAEDRELDLLEESVERVTREREPILVEMLALLERAEKLDPRNDEVRRLRAELYAEQFEQAENARDPVLTAFYLERVQEIDPAGAFTERASAKGMFSLESDPPGAELYLFRHREEAELNAGGEHRLVPVPVGDPAPAVPPGTWCLRVARGAEEIAEGDLIVELGGHPVRGTLLVSEGAGEVAPLDRLVTIDGQPARDEYDLDFEAAAAQGARRVYGLERAGRPYQVEGPTLAALGIRVLAPAALAERGGVPARVYSRGELREYSLPRGLRVRLTAAPLLLSPACRAGLTPVGPLELEPGGYLALLRRDGCEDQRHAFRVGRGEVGTCRVKLQARGAGPEGFVRVVNFPGSMLNVADFWLQEREITFAEYVEFLNDPETLARIGTSPEPILVPRDAEEHHCARGADGLYAVRGQAQPDWPVFGISWFEAQDYARWRSARARSAGQAFEFSLPTFEQWKLAGHGADRRIYVFGSRFRPKWMKSNYARPVGNPEPGLRFPVDESVYGAFDMSGSVMEWLEDWYRVDERRRAAGGAWGQSDAVSYFLVEGGSGVAPQARSNLVGLRLAARRTDG